MEQSLELQASSGVTAAAGEGIIREVKVTSGTAGRPKSRTAHLDSQPSRANTFQIHFQGLDFRLF